MGACNCSTVTFESRGRSCVAARAGVWVVQRRGSCGKAGRCWSSRPTVSPAAGQKLPNLTYLHVRVEDAVSERGPIEGLRAALTAAGEAGCTLMYALSVDLPLLDPALLARLRDRLDTGDEAIVPLAEGFRQPLCALYRVSILPTVERGDPGAAARAGRLCRPGSVRSVAAELEPPGGLARISRSLKPAPFRKRRRW
jgi:molybdopterin-guanine dinucleotide biosynthesis protein A